MTTLTTKGEVEPPGGARANRREQVADAPQHDPDHGHVARPDPVLPAAADHGADPDHENRQAEDQARLGGVPAERGDQRLGEVAPLLQP